MDVSSVILYVGDIIVYTELIKSVSSLFSLNREIIKKSTQLYWVRAWAYFHYQ